MTLVAASFRRERCRVNAVFRCRVSRPPARRLASGGRRDDDAYCDVVVSEGAGVSVAAGSPSRLVALSSQAARATTAKRAVAAVRRGLPMDAVRLLSLVI